MDQVSIIARIDSSLAVSRGNWKKIFTTYSLHFSAYFLVEPPLCVFAPCHISSHFDHRPPDLLCLLLPLCHAATQYSRNSPNCALLVSMSSKGPASTSCSGARPRSRRPCWNLLLRCRCHMLVLCLYYLPLPSLLRHFLLPVHLFLPLGSLHHWSLVMSYQRNIYHICR